MDVDGYAGRVMALIAADQAGRPILINPEHLPQFYMAKIGVPDALRLAVAEEVIRRLRDDPA